MDRALKQRLVGAIILIALAVIFLPMLLDGGDGQDPATRSIDIPPRPDVEFQTRRLPVGEQSTVAPASTEAEQDQPEAEDTRAGTQPNSQASGQPLRSDPRLQDSPVEIQRIQPPQVKTSEVEDAAPGNSGNGGESVQAAPSRSPEQPPEQAAGAASPATASPAVSEMWLVQVASLSNGDNANRLADQLAGMGYATMIDATRSGDTLLHRLRLGPYATEAEAGAVLRRISAAVEGISPKVMQLDKAGAGSAVGMYMVQTGSFSSAANADRQVQRLQAAGFSAYRERVSGTGGVAFKVKAGPAEDEADAAVLKERIQQQLGIAGLVVRNL